jgi:hypothetical protein
MTTICYDCARTLEPGEKRQIGFSGNARCMPCVEQRARRENVMDRFDTPDEEMRREESQ